MSKSISEYNNYSQNMDKQELNKNNQHKQKYPNKYKSMHVCPKVYF